MLTQGKGCCSRPHAGWVGSIDSLMAMSGRDCARGHAERHGATLPGTTVHPCRRARAFEAFDRRTDTFFAATTGAGPRTKCSAERSRLSFSQVKGADAWICAQPGQFVDGRAVSLLRDRGALGVEVGDAPVALKERVL